MICLHESWHIYSCSNRWKGKSICLVVHLLLKFSLDCNLVAFIHTLFSTMMKLFNACVNSHKFPPGPMVTSTFCVYVFSEIVHLSKLSIHLLLPCLIIMQPTTGYVGYGWLFEEAENYWTQRWNCCGWKQAMQRYLFSSRWDANKWQWTCQTSFKFWWYWQNAHHHSFKGSGTVTSCFKSYFK